MLSIKLGIIKMARRALPPTGPSRGTLLATVGSVCAAVGGFAIEFLPNTVYLEKYKSIVQMYRYVLILLFQIKLYIYH